MRHNHVCSKHHVRKQEINKMTILASILTRGSFRRLTLPRLVAAGVFIVVLGGIMAGCGGPAAFSVTPTQKDVAYTSTAGTQKLDLYLPAGEGPFPVIVNIHGGGFKLGDKGMVDNGIGKAFLNAGYAIASIDYRLSGEAKFPAAVLDAKAAVRFLRANAAKYNLDPNKIVAFGENRQGETSPPCSAQPAMWRNSMIPPLVMPACPAGFRL
jgi:hypothetical protein